MSQTDWLQLVIALVLVVFAGLTSAAEAALSSFSKVRATRLVDEGFPGAARLRRIVDDPPRFLNTALFLRTMIEISSITLVAKVIFSLVPVTWEAGAITAGSMILVSYIFWGVAPRTLGRQHADRVACAAAGPLVLLTTVLGPFPRLLIMIGNALTPGKGFTDGPFSTEAELRELVDLAEASAVIESGERRMIHSVFDLGNTLVREVMVPRTDVVSVRRGTGLHDVEALLLRSGYSRMPVVGEDADDVLGIVYLKDIARRFHTDPAAARADVAESVARPPVFVPDSLPVDDLLRQMQRDTTHVAIVVDEYGGTAGLVTIEDAIEEIVGDIADEHDREAPEVERLDDGGFRVSTRLAVDDLGELFDLEIDDEEVDTVGGLLAKALGEVPVPGAVTTAHGLRLQADRQGGRRNQVRTVLVHRVQPDPAPDDDTAREPTRAERAEARAEAREQKVHRQEQRHEARGRERSDV